MSRRRDPHTADLFGAASAPSVVPRFEAERIKAVGLQARVARAVSETLKDCEQSRNAIAEQMSAFLGDRVPLSMLDAYASLAKDAHNIPAHRLIALVAVAGDARLLNALLADTGFIAIESKYEALIRREMAREARAEIDKAIATADAEWKAQR